MNDAVRLFDALAEDYERHFAELHRRAYDDLAWEQVAALARRPATVVDVGCGIGRWAGRLLAGGHRVIGIEPSPRMAERAARVAAPPGFTLHRVPIEQADLPPGCADVVLAMGSLQYTDDPTAALARCARWLRAGGTLVVLVDSLVALAAELVAAGRLDEALARAATRRGRWRTHGREADVWLFDRRSLADAGRNAGLQVDRIAGLLVGATAYGRAELARRLRTDYSGQLAEERRLAADPALADLGKQLLMVARWPI